LSRSRSRNDTRRYIPPDVRPRDGDRVTVMVERPPRPLAWAVESAPGGPFARSNPDTTQRLLRALVPRQAPRRPRPHRRRLDTEGVGELRLRPPSPALHGRDLVGEGYGFRVRVVPE